MPWKKPFGGASFASHFAFLVCSLPGSCRSFPQSLKCCPTQKSFYLRETEKLLMRDCSSSKRKYEPLSTCVRAQGRRACMQACSSTHAEEWQHTQVDGRLHRKAHSIRDYEGNVNIRLKWQKVSQSAQLLSVTHFGHIENERGRFSFKGWADRKCLGLLTWVWCLHFLHNPYCQQSYSINKCNFVKLA